MSKPGVIERLGQWHSKVFSYVSEKAKTSKIWAVALSVLVVYELIEHLVFPWLVPLLAYMTFGK